MKKASFVTSLILATMASRGLAMDAHTARVLMKIEPDTRLEQVCDMEAMRQIKNVKPFKPDRAKSDVISSPHHDGDTMSAPGAAFRSRGAWYALSLQCSGSPDHLQVRHFTYTIGDEIPRARWNDYDLWP